MADNYETQLEEAYKLHTSGKLSEAKSMYEQLMNIKPEDYNLLFLYSQLNISLKNYDIALNISKKLYNETKSDDVKLNIAKIYFYKNEYAKTIEILDEIEKLTPEIAKLLVIIYNRTENYKKAIEIYNKMIEMNCMNYIDYYNLSTIYFKITDYDNALKYVLIANQIKSDDIEINLQLANIYNKLNQDEEELRHLLKVEKINNKNSDVLYRIGNIYKKYEMSKEALEYFDKVLEIDPKNKNTYVCIYQVISKFDKNGALKVLNDASKLFPDENYFEISKFFVYSAMMDFENAYKIACELLEKEPENADYNEFAAISLESMERYEEAKVYYEKLLKHNPNNISAINGLSEIYSQEGNGDKAQAFLKAAGIGPDKYSYMFVALRNKNFQEVKDAFFHRHFQVKDFYFFDERARRMYYRLKVNERFNSITEDVFAIIKSCQANETFSLPEEYNKKCPYDKDITNKRLLIYSMHGMGDYFMSIRYIEKMKKITPHIILTVPDSIKKLMEYNIKGIKMVSQKERVPEDEYDYAIPLFNILCYTNVDFKNIEYSKGYLKIDEKDIKEKSELDIFKTDKLKVGLYWQGNPSILLNRSIKLKNFSELFSLDDIKYYSFQISKIDLESEQYKKEINIVDLAPLTSNYYDTAAYLKNIDILITIDSSIAHLAGALGIKTYLLLPKYAEWRWFNDTKTTSWYDSITIFKQTKPNDWQEVISRVKNELNVQRAV